MPGDVVAEGVAVGHDVGERVAPLAGQVDGPVAAVEGPDGPPDDPPPEPEGQHREEDAPGVEPAGRGGDQGDADDALAEELRVLLGEADDAHAAHGVADEDDRAGGGLLDDPQQVLAELVDGGVLLRGARGPAVGALVVEHRAHLAAVAGALEVPAVHVHRVAVGEDDRRSPVASRWCSVGSTSSTSVCRSTASSAMTWSGVERSEPNGVSSPTPRWAMTRLRWATTPAAAPAAARPAAAPITRRPMCPRAPLMRVLRPRGVGPGGRRPASRSRS